MYNGENGNKSFLLHSITFNFLWTKPRFLPQLIKVYPQGEEVIHRY